MSELNEKLLEIKRQKDTYILPENLKKNVEVFGITGTLEPGSSGSGDVKLFETIEEMQQDPNPQEEDLAIVYKNEINSCTADSYFSTALFPKTVILDEVLQDYVPLYFRPEDTSGGYFECYGEITSNYMNMSCYGETAGGWFDYQIEYSTEDGLTYTRTRFRGPDGDISEDTIDFGQTIYYANPEEWDNAIGKFIKCSNNIFNGLYKYTLNYSDPEYISNRPSNNYIVSGEADGDNINVTVTINDDIDTASLNKANINVLHEVLNSIRTSDNTLYSGLLFQTSTNTIRIIYSDSGDYSVYDMQGNYIGVGLTTGNSSYTPRSLRCFNIDLEHKTYEEIESITESNLGRQGDTYNWYGIPANIINNLICIQVYVNSSRLELSAGYSLICIDSEGVLNAAECYDIALPYNYINNRYIPAPNQFSNLTEGQLLPDKTVYAKKGIITGDGSIYSFNNLDNNKIKEMVVPSLEETNDNIIYKWGGTNINIDQNTIQKWCYDTSSNMLLGVLEPEILSNYSYLYFQTYIGFNPNTQLDIYCGVDTSTRTFYIGGINPSTLEITQIGQFTGLNGTVNMLCSTITAGFFLDIETNRLYAAHSVYGSSLNWKLLYMDLSTGIVTECFDGTRNYSAKYFDLIGVDNISNKMYFKTRVYENNKYTSTIFSTPLDSYSPVTLGTYETSYLCGWTDANSIWYIVSNTSNDDGLYKCTKGGSSFTKGTNNVMSWTSGVYRTIPLDHNLVSLIGVGIFDNRTYESRIYSYSNSTIISNYFKKEVSEIEIDGNMHEIITYYTSKYIKCVIDYYDNSITITNKYPNAFYIRTINGETSLNLYSLWFDEYYYRSLVLRNNSLNLFSFVPVKAYDISNTEHDGVTSIRFLDENETSHVILLNDYEFKTLNPVSSGGPISQEDYDAAMAYLDEIGV